MLNFTLINVVTYLIVIVLKILEQNGTVKGTRGQCPRPPDGIEKNVHIFKIKTKKSITSLSCQCLNRIGHHDSMIFERFEAKKS